MSDTSSPQQTLAEAMSRARFRDFCRTFIRIEDKAAGIVPLVLNEAQLIIDDAIEDCLQRRVPVRALVLKGRQQGASTYCQARLAHRALTTRTRALTVGHQLAATHELWGKLDRIWREMATSDHAKALAKAGITLQPPLEPGLGEKGRRTVFADPLGSVCRYDSAADPQSVGRGITAQVAHLTEVPSWAKADETMQAILATIPPTPDTMVFVETTAKGASGWFYDKFTEAMLAIKRGETPRWVPIFVPWFKTSEYARKRHSGEPSLRPSEREFKHKYGLTDAQCYWYRDARQEFGEKVVEEYPSSWEEAFLSSGLPYFRRDAMSEYREAIREPVRVGRFRMIAPKVAAWENQPGDDTNIYGNPEDGHRYSIGVDFASGRLKDASAIVVVDVDDRAVVATYRSNDTLPDRVLDQAVLLALVYNKALIVPERNGIGEALVNRLVAPVADRGLGYRNVYVERDPIAVKYHKGTRFGWATSNRTRKPLLESLARVVHDRSLAIPCQRIVGEMQNFVYTNDDDDHAEAAQGSHDDMVMALAFAVRGMDATPRQMSDGMTTPAQRRESVISSRTGY